MLVKACFNAALPKDAQDDASWYSTCISYCESVASALLGAVTAFLLLPWINSKCEIVTILATLSLVIAAGDEIDCTNDGGFEWISNADHANTSIAGESTPLQSDL